MKQNRFPILFLLVCLLLVSMACSVSTSSSEQTRHIHATSTTTPDVNATPTHDPNAPALPATTSPDGSGIACIGLRDGGISCINGDGWKTYNKDTGNASLSSNYVPKGTVCPKDHRIVVAVSDGINLFDGDKWEHIDKPSDYDIVNGIACGENGDIWIAHYNGVSHYSDDKWTTYDSSKLATGDDANDLVLDVAVDTDNNRVWALTPRSVALFEDDKWTVFEKGQGFNEDLYFQGLALDSSGRPWVGYGRGVAVYDNNTWKLIPKSGYDFVQGMSFDSSGNLWMATLNNGAVMYNGNSWKYYNVDGKNLSSDHVYSVTGDSRGRVWLSTSYGLTVMDNNQWKTYRMDNSDIADNYVEFAAVVKDGPTIPDLNTKIKASITGILEDADNNKLTDANVEICVEPISARFTGDTPCSDQPYFMSVKTDSDGKFTFNEVPPGYYVLVAQTKSGWVKLNDQLADGSERTLIESGKQFDAGTLNVGKEAAIMH